MTTAVNGSAGSDPSAVDFYVLLETLEDIGRLMSMNHDLDTLVPTIVSTAKSTLKCGACEVYLWDAGRQELVNPLMQGPSSPRRYIVDAEGGIGGWVIRERSIWTRSSAANAPELEAALAEEGPLPDAVAPLTAGMELLGVLVISQAEELTANLEPMLSTLAGIYGLGIRNALLFRRVEEMARRDGLTGLYNHATFQHKLRSLVRDSIENRTPLSLVMSDIDAFKRFNDEFGHQAGDDVLREVAHLWTAIVPETAVLARYGGEEFIVALPGLDQEQAVELAELLRSSIEQHAIFSSGRPLQVTSSFGVAELHETIRTADDFVRDADRSLYAAKRSGRNCVRPHTPRRSLTASRSIEASIIR